MGLLAIFVETLFFMLLAIFVEMLFFILGLTAAIAADLFVLLLRVCTNMPEGRVRVAASILVACTMVLCIFWGLCWVTEKSDSYFSDFHPTLLPIHKSFEIHLHVEFGLVSLLLNLAQLVFSAAVVVVLGLLMVLMFIGAAYTSFLGAFGFCIAFARLRHIAVKGVC